MRIRRFSITLHRAKCFCNTFGYILTSVERHQAPAPGNKIYKTLESRLDRLQIVIDIRVIELYMCQDRGVWKVVQKLRAFIEERRVVLIAFNQERARVSH